MTRNPFTDESRDARLSLDVDLTGGDTPTKLRAPEALAYLVKGAKPAHLSVGTFALKGMLDAIIDAAKVQGDYRTIQRTLDTLFGPVVPDGTPAAEPPRKPLAPVTAGTVSAVRHPRSA